MTLCVLAGQERNNPPLITFSRVHSSLSSGVSCVCGICAGASAEGGGGEGAEGGEGKP